MKHRVIAISREFGSGGRTIGKKTAERLGIPCYDTQLLQKVAEESGLHTDYVKEAGEYAPRGLLNAVFSHRAAGPNNADYLWTIQYRIITRMAEEGPCVIVGRCADFILRGKADCLRVFVCADLSFRAKRIVEVYKECTRMPERRLREMDRQRAAYYRFYTDMTWGRPQNYDIVLNSGALGIDRCAEILCGLYGGCEETSQKEL